MPNIRGGKGYKKMKGRNDDDDENVIFIDKAADQLVGRLIRLLGDRNTMVFCEDKKERICKISTGIKKKVRFEAGDIVLVSLRDCEVSKANLDKGIRSDRGDILAKYSPQQYDSLKKDGVNPHLFATLETVATISGMMRDGNEQAADALATSELDDMFDRSRNNDGDDGEAAPTVNLDTL